MTDEAAGEKHACYEAVAHVVGGTLNCAGKDAQGELLPIIPDPMMELMKLKEADIIELLDAETFGG